MAPYVFETAAYKSLDYDYADEFWAKDNDNWKVGCSAITKVVDDGHRLVGRNMDLNISHKALYVVRGEGEKYNTIGIAYTFRDYSPDYEDVKKNGLTEDFSKILPFICDDVLNDQGLHIELNMRSAENDADGNDMFCVESTNPGQRRVHMFELPRYIAENCSNVDEVKDYVENKLDIYSKNGYWNYSFLISDAQGNATLLEIANPHNELRSVKGTTINWLDEKDISSVDWLYTGSGENKQQYTLNALGQTNYYLTKKNYLRQDHKLGEGRFLALQKGINEVQNKNQMFNLLNSITYSNFYLDYDECKNKHFDPRSEIIGEPEGLTYSFVMDDANESLIASALNEQAKAMAELSREDKVKKGDVWESSYTEVVDTNSKSIFIRMFEDNSLMFNITFEETTLVDKN